jgi:hypothetical protein
VGKSSESVNEAEIGMDLRKIQAEQAGSLRIKSYKIGCQAEMLLPVAYC